MIDPFKPSLETKWQYYGDIDEGDGGLWFKESDDADYVYFAELICRDNLGFPSNEFVLNLGSICVDEEQVNRFKIKNFNIICDFGKPTRHEFIFNIYYTQGGDYTETYFLRVGKNQDNKSNIDHEIKEVLRSNVNLRHHIEKSYLSWRS